jgi:hypothetical protein
MPLSREIDFLPGGDFAFMALIPPYGLSACELWFYDWDQVEKGRDDGRTHPPAFHAVIGDREMLTLARHLLKAAGHKAYKEIEVPEQDWNLTGRDR